MISASENYNLALSGYSRTFKASIQVDGTEIDGDIQTVDVYRGTGSESLLFGATFAPYFTAKIANLNTTLYDAEVTLRVGVKVSGGSYEYITIGKYHISDISIEKDVSTIKGIGTAFWKLQGKNIPTTGSNKPITLLQDIRNVAGVTILSDFSNDRLDRTIRVAIKKNDEAHSCQEVLSIVAALMGGFVTEDNAGRIVLKEYASGSTISYSADRFINTPAVDRYGYEITGVKCIIHDNEGNEYDPASYSTGDVNYTFRNKYMTQSLFNDMADTVIGLRHYPGFLGISLGDPRIDPWDILSVTDANGLTKVTYPMQIHHHIDGGLSTDIDAEMSTATQSGSVTEAINSLNTNVTTATSMASEANALLSSMEQAATAAQTTLTGIYQDAADAQTNADEALRQAGIATTNANTAIEQAGIATTSANEAKQQASAAASAASTAQQLATQAGASAAAAQSSADDAASAAQTAWNYADTANTAAGNAASAASTAQSSADEAIRQAGIATTNANTAITQAGIATTNANEAIRQAGIAVDNAATAVSSANTAVEAATSATVSANSALNQLSIVEDVVDVLNWIAEHGTYIASTDTEVVPGKFYFTRSGSGTSADPYVYTVVTNPTGNPSTSGYYELDSVDEAISNYVSTHLSLTSEGLYVLKDNSGWKVLITNNGVYIQNPSGTTVATYSSDIVLGLLSSSHTNISTDGMRVYGADGTTQIAHLGYGRVVWAGAEQTGIYYTFGNRITNVPAYSSSSTYAEGDLCMYNNMMFVCVVQISTPEAFNTYHWELTGIGECSMAEGGNVHAGGHHSHAEGYKTVAAGTYSHAEGYDTVTLDNAAHAEGWGTVADGTSHAEGRDTKAMGLYSHSQNHGTIANGDRQTALGRYNVAETAKAVIIGNGTADNARSNALTVDWDGIVQASGVIAYGVCDTAGATAAKVVTVSHNGFKLVTGSQVLIKFTNANTVASPTLNVNSTGAKAIRRYGTTAPSTSAASSWNAGSVILLIYDGTDWQMVGFLNTTYSSMTDAEYQAGTSTTARLITPARLKSAILYHATPTNTGAMPSDYFIWDTYSKSITVSGSGAYNFTMGTLTQHSGYTLRGYINQNGGYTDQWLVSYGTYGSNVVAMVYSKYGASLTSTISCTAIWTKNI